MDPDFTIVYRATKEPQIDPSEMPLVLQRLNGDRLRKELPRFIGLVLGFSCAISGKTEEELKHNAKRRIQGLGRVRMSRGIPIRPIGAKVAVQPSDSSGWKTAIITVPESVERFS